MTPWLLPPPPWGRDGTCCCLEAHDISLRGGHHTVPFLSVFWRSRSEVQWSALNCHCMSNCEPLVIVCSKAISRHPASLSGSKETRSLTAYMTHCCPQVHCSDMAVNLANMLVCAPHGGGTRHFDQIIWPALISARSKAKQSC